MSDMPVGLTQHPGGYAGWLTNLVCMRAFVGARPDAEFVQEALAQLPWYHQWVPVDALPGPEGRRCSAANGAPKAIRGTVK